MLPSIPVNEFPPTRLWLEMEHASFDLRQMSDAWVIPVSRVTLPQGRGRIISEVGHARQTWSVAVGEARGGASDKVLISDLVELAYGRVSRSA